MYQESPSRDPRKAHLQRSQMALTYTPDTSTYASLSDSPARSTDSSYQQHQSMYNTQHSIPQSPRYSPGRHGDAKIRRERLQYAAAARPPMRLVSPARQEKPATRLPSRPTPVVFASQYESPSVVTGISQQELLRKKARDHGKKKRHRNAKKKNLHPIVNLPMALSQGLVMPKKNYYGNINSVAGSSDSRNPTDSSSLYVHGDFSRGYKPMTTIVDDMEQSAAESTRSSARYAMQTNNNYGTPSLYSTLPVQQTILNEADDDGILMWSVLDDAQSVDSFPILSKHCGLSLSGLDTVANAPRQKEQDDSRTSGGNMVSQDSSQTTPRAVRFSHQDSYSSIPWDERQDEYAKDSDYDEEPGERSRSTTSPQSSIVSPKSGDSAPRSILRATRFSAVGAGARTSTAYYAQLQAFRDKHTRRTKAIADRASTAPIYKSPPRQKSKFTDFDGGELSPIEASALQMKSKTSGLESNRSTVLQRDDKKAKAFLKILEDANNIYQSSSPNFVEDDHLFLPLEQDLDVQSQKSDPGENLSRELEDEGMDDEEDETSAAATFIRTIAAVVIQTAFRRYSVQWVYADMLARRKLVRLRQQRELEHNEMSSSRRASVSRVDSSIPTRAVNFDAHWKQTDKSHVATRPRSVKESSSGYKQCMPKHESVENTAAKLIQAVFRGYWTRDCMSVDSYCATLIQKTWRSHQARHVYLFDLYGIVLIQSVWRRALARDQVCIRFYAMILLQKAARGFLARKGHRDWKRRNGSRSIAGRVKVGARHSSGHGALSARRPRTRRFDPRTVAAAIMIQKTWRQFRDERMYIQRLVDILTVQSLVRRWIEGRRDMKRSQGRNISLERMYGLKKSTPSSCTATTTGLSDGRTSETNTSCADYHPDTRSIMNMWQQRSKLEAAR